MNIFETRDRLEKYGRMLESSLGMYINTIGEMKERGCDQDMLSFMKSMKEELEENLAGVRSSLATLDDVEKRSMDDREMVNKAIAEMNENFEPFFTNRFIVDFGRDEIKPYYVEGVSYTDDNLLITFRNSDKFFAPEYFARNRYFYQVSIFLLGPDQERKAEVEFRDVRVSQTTTKELTYSKNDPLTTQVIFTCEVVHHRQVQ